MKTLEQWKYSAIYEMFLQKDAYLSYFIFGQRPRQILFVGKHQQSRPSQTLRKWDTVSYSMTPHISFTPEELLYGLMNRMKYLSLSKLWRFFYFKHITAYNK